MMCLNVIQYNLWAMIAKVFFFIIGTGSQIHIGGLRGHIIHKWLRIDIIIHWTLMAEERFYKLFRLSLVYRLDVDILNIMMRMYICSFDI
jgi:hypothetical protein